MLLKISGRHLRFDFERYVKTLPLQYGRAKISLFIWEETSSVISLLILIWEVLSFIKVPIQCHKPESNFLIKSKPSSQKQNFDLGCAVSI